MTQNRGYKAARAGAAVREAYELATIGVTHHACAPRLRDLLYVPEDSVAGTLRALAESAPVPLDEAVLISTCDRVEFLVSAPSGALPALSEHLRRGLASLRGVDAALLEGAWRMLSGDTAAEHWINIASGLDSQVLGDPQIHGQVRTAARHAAEAGLFGAELDAVMQSANRAARRIRRETALAEGPATIAAAAVGTARAIFGDLDTCGALIVGDGEMGDLMARALRLAGLGDLTVTDPVSERAHDMAERLDCHVAPYSALRETLPRMDIVVGATSQRELVATRDNIGTALRRRRQRPMFLIDAAVPADFDPGIDRLDEAYRYTLADLEAIAMTTLLGRDKARRDAAAIVADELQAFRERRGGSDAAQSIAALRRHFEAERQRVLSSVDLPGASEATRLLINRLLHRPATLLREAGSDEEKAILRRLLDRLLGPQPAADGEPGDPDTENKK